MAGYRDAPSTFGPILLEGEAIPHAKWQEAVRRFEKRLFASGRIVGIGNAEKSDAGAPKTRPSWELARQGNSGTLTQMRAPLRSNYLLPPATFAAFLATVAGITACPGQYDRSNTCPDVETRSVSPESACATLAATTSSKTYETCTVEKEFADLFAKANLKVVVDPVEAGLDADSDVAEASDADRPDSSVDAGDAGDAGDAAAARTYVCPPFDRKVTVQCSQICASAGRPFEGYDTPEMRGNSAGHFFEACAYTEAASVDAFYILAEELRALGAPSELSDACVRSARDEHAHAALMSQLAGIPCVFVHAPPRPLRGAFELAIENARSGLVNETFAAVVNRYQSIHAASAEVRDTLARIADDEARHAHLSRRIHAFLLANLSPEDAQAVEAAREQATADLECRVRGTAPTMGDTMLGLPGRGEQLVFIEGLRSEVWSLDTAA